MLRSSKDKSALCDTLATFGMLLIVLIAPLFVVPLPGIPFLFAKTGLILGGTLLVALSWITARLISGRFSVPASPLVASGIVVAVVFALAALFSPVVSISWSGDVFETGTAVAIIGFVALMVLAALRGGGAVFVTRLLQALLISFSIIASLQVVRMMGGGSFLELGGVNTASTTLFGSWGTFVFFAGWAALSSVLMLEFGKFEHHLARMALWIVLILALLMMLMVNSPLAWGILSVIVAIVFTYRLSLFCFNTSTRSERRFPVAALIIALFAGFFAFVGGPIGEVIADRADVARLEVRPSWQATSQIISETWSERALFGVGPQRFSVQWQQHRPESVRSTAFWNTDFDYGVGLLPTFAVTTGVLGVLAWIFFIGAFAYRGARTVFAVRLREQYDVLIPFTLALYGWLVAIFAVPNSTLFAFAFLFTGVLVGQLVRYEHIRAYTVDAYKDPRVGFVAILGSIALILLLAVGLYGVGQRVLGYAFAYRAQVEAGAGEFATADASIARAARMTRNASLARTRAQLIEQRLFQLLQETDKTAEEVRGEFQSLLSNAISSAREAINRNPHDYINWYSLARVYGSLVTLNVSGAYQSAVGALEEAEKRSPNNPLLALERAQLERANGDLEAARTYIRRALERKSNYTDAILLLAQIEVESGNVNNAITSLEQAVVLEPNNPGLFFQLGLLRYRQGNTRGAAAAFEQAVAQANDYANARYFLGLAYEQNGNTQQAIEQFERILETNPNNEEVQGILENLRSGKAPFAESEVEPPEERSEAPIPEDGETDTPIGE